MRAFLLSITTLLILVTTTSAEEVLRGKAANDLVYGAEQVRLKDHSTIPAHIKFRADHRIQFATWQTWMKNKYFKNINAGFELIGTESDRLGMIHYRYQQTFGGFPATFGIWIVHTLNGEVVSMNGELFNEVPPLNPALSEAQALQEALGHIDAETYKWEVELEEHILKLESNDPNATYYPEGRLEIVNQDVSLKVVDLKLAWKFNVYAHSPMSRREIYVDASNGDIVFENNLIHHADSNGVAVTGYSDTQEIVCDHFSGGFRLRESGRGNGVFTYDMNHGTSYGAAGDFVHSDVLWDTSSIERFGTDAHWGAEMTYDYYFSNYNRNSINNNGFPLRSYVHYGNNYGNAFWDGQRMTYGDGSSGTSPFTALDIAGHEVTHGLTSFTANLVYQNEPGALNESFSDIFGVAIEFFAHGGNGNWLMGEDLGFVIRSMSNPNSYGDPDTYFGSNWYTGANDNGGVHTNSGVQNKWFHLLTVGGSGTNDLGNSYSVTALGIEDAGAIAYRNLTTYLTVSSQYADARYYAIQSALDLYGACSQEVISTGMAWYAVGVGNIYSSDVDADFSSNSTGSCALPFEIDFYNYSSNATSFNWNFGDGGSSTAANPSHTYTTAGTYTVSLQASSTCGADTLEEIAYIQVGPGAPCEVSMPESGAGTTQTECEGVLFDNGGPSGNYGDNTDSYITLSPVGATSVDLIIDQFDVEAGGGTNCIYDYVEIYDGPSTSSPVIGKYCNSNPPPAVVSSTNSSMTIRMYADGGLNLPGFRFEWECVAPTTPPTAAFSASSDESCTGVISFNDESTNGAQSWLWNFGDGNTSTSQHPVHTYLSNGSYTVSLKVTNNIGSDSTTVSNVVTINRPDAPEGDDDDICPGESGTLIVTSNGENRWYDAPLNGTLVHVGDTFVTPVVQQSTAYYVESVIENTAQSVGPANNTFGGGSYYNSYQYLVFDAHAPFLLESVRVYATGAGERTIQLRDANQNVLDEITVDMAGGQEVITLNFDVPVGTDHELGISSTSIANMFRNNSGVNYPYEISNIVSITKSSANTDPYGYYYFFYDWVIKDLCVSERHGIAASTGICTGIEDNGLSSFDVYPNPTRDMVTVSWISEADFDQIYIYDARGSLIKSVDIDQENGLQSVSLTDLEAGFYMLQIDELPMKRIIKQ